MPNALDPSRGVSKLFEGMRGQEIFVVCGGTSLEGFDFDQLIERNTVAVNRVPLKAAAQSDWVPDFLCITDCNLWPLYDDFYARDQMIPISQEAAFKEYDLASGYWFNPVAQLDKIGRIDESNDLFMHHTVAAVAIHLTFLLGAGVTYVLGLDGYDKPETTYFWGEKQGGEYDDMKNRGKRWAKDMDNLKSLFPDRKVYNLSPDSVVTAWPKKKLEIHP
jgi:hypothetical protein